MPDTACPTDDCAIAGSPGFAIPALLRRAGHGGTADNFMCHIAMLEGTTDGDDTTWLEPVTDKEYQDANAS